MVTPTKAIPTLSQLAATGDVTNVMALMPGIIPAVLVIGLLILPLIYDALFYSILRERFILFHIFMVVAMLVFAMTTPELGNVIFADVLANWVRRLNMTAYAVMGIFALLLANGMIEERFRKPNFTRIFHGLAIAAALVTIVILLTGWVPADGEYAFYTVVFFFPAIIALGVFAYVIGRGSHVALWLALSLTGALAAAVIVSLESLGWLDWDVNATGLALLGVVVLAIATSLGVGDRFVELRRDRDRAVVRATKMGRMARTDSLTGLANRRAFEQILQLHVGEGLLIADIDRFKSINDAYGHQIGDAVLRHTANVLREAMGTYAPAEIYRIGGEEFAIICPAQRPAQLMTMAEELREQVASEALNMAEDALPHYTISLGAVVGRGQELDLAFAEADSALYGAKAMGRDRSVLYRYNPGAEGVDETIVQRAAFQEEGELMGPLLSGSEPVQPD